MIKKFLQKIIIGIVVKKVKENVMFKKVVGWLSGKKTYLSMVGVIIEAVVQYLGDQDLGGLINKILIAFGGMSLRSGVAKAVKPE